MGIVLCISMIRWRNAGPNQTSHQIQWLALSGVFDLIWFISVKSTCKHDYKKTIGATILVTRDERHYEGSGDPYFHSGPQKVDQMATGKVYKKIKLKIRVKSLYKINYK